ncbi:MAG: double zinc ribbon domain-containing protein [Candidatus Kryptoniota bacterium]
MIGSSKAKARQKVELERYRLCPGCGLYYSMAEQVLFCPNCGERLIEECPRCGEPIVYPTAKFCPVCGQKYGKE